jgi:hypothetical protein
MKRLHAADIFETIAELDFEEGGFASAEAWQGEVNRKSREYIRWVQSALNRIMGLRLAVDGIVGSQTRSAIRRFQQQRGLTVDGIVGSQTEAALIAAGASPPPGFTATGTATGGATLADLASFGKSYINQIINAGRKLDCADLAIEVWIRFGEQYGIPVSFRFWDSSQKRYTTVQRSRFPSTDAFVRYVQGNLGAVGLIGNTYEVAGGHRAAVAGDIFLWRYYHETTRRQHRWGHTQILQQVQRGSGGPNTDQITIVQGDLPPIVPIFRTLPASYFYQPRHNVNLRTSAHPNAPREPHVGLLVGNGPRRFRSFQNLQ